MDDLLETSPAGRMIATMSDLGWMMVHAEPARRQGGGLDGLIPTDGTLLHFQRPAQATGLESEPGPDFSCGRKGDD